MADADKQKMSVPAGMVIVVMGYCFDAIIFVLDWTVIGLALAWAVSFLAYLSLSIALALQGAFGLKRGIIMVGPLFGGAVGIPGWGTTMWIMIARTIAADKLNQVTPGLGQIANKIGNK